MLIRDSLQHDIEPLSLQTSVPEALELMRKYDLQHLPIVQEHHLLGILAKPLLLQATEKQEVIADLPFDSIQDHYVRDNQHFLEAVVSLAEKKLTCIPVLSQQSEYLGVITRQHVLNYLAELAVAKQPGGILVIDLLKRNYALSEIASIAEHADAKILISYVSQHPDPERLYVNLKFNTEELSRVVAGLERYGYEVSYLHQSNSELFDTGERMEALLKFLNI